MSSSPGGESSLAGCATQVADMGCSNWDQILLLSTSLPSPDECCALCSSTPGCAIYNYQPTDCPPDPGDGLAAQTCYLFEAGCQELSNECWDLYYMDTPTPAAFTMSAGRTGCSNWASLQMGTTACGLSSGQCSIACSETPGCEAFNYQPDPCGGDEQACEGACMLLNGECEQASNPCWNLYPSGGPPIPSSPSPISPSPYSPSPWSPSPFSPSPFSPSPFSPSPWSPSPSSPSPSSPSPFSPSPSSPSPCSPSPQTTAATTTAATTTAATTTV